ncbi:hypothetical protein K2Y11_23485 [bacterium]|nr:hypothetical protein [bacterium]
MNPRTSSIFWYAAWRIGLIAIFLSFVGYIVWLQRYTFTDQEVQHLFGGIIHRTNMHLDEGQRICFGRLIDGSRIVESSRKFSSGMRKAIIVACYRDERLTVSLELKPAGYFGLFRSKGVSPGSLFSCVDGIHTNRLDIRFNEQPDGSVWLAEWVEEKEGQKKIIKYGYWIE